MAVGFRTGIARHAGLRPRFRNRQTGRAGMLHCECTQSNRIVCRDSKVIYITIVLFLQAEIELSDAVDTNQCGGARKTPKLITRVPVVQSKKPLVQGNRVNSLVTSD